MVARLVWLLGLELLCLVRSSFLLILGFSLDYEVFLVRAWRGVTGWLVVIGLEFVCLGLFELFAWVCWRPVVLGWVMALGGCCVWFELLRCCVCVVG